MQVKQAYRLWATEYDATPNPLLSLEQRAIAPLILSAKGRDVVDLGCGTGRWLAQLEQLSTRSITGIDLSEEMLACASAKLKSNARLIHADCLNCTLATASTDWILSSFLLSYLPSITQFAGEAARIARVGALVLISDVHPAAKEYGWRRTFHYEERVIEIHTNFYRLSNLHTWMGDAGFEPAFYGEHSFGEPEQKIFADAGRPDLFARVEGLPVLYVAGYHRCGE